jgi:ATP-dependent DNA helicase RecG
MATNNRDKHPWENLSDDEIIQSAGLYEDDVATGAKGYNLACILLFGRDEVIQSCALGYITDALLRKENLDRYDDRLMVRTNLIDSYDMLMEFIAKHTLDRFFLIDGQRVSIRDKIARELVSNSLTHREFSSTMPAKIVVEQDRIYSENWNRSITHGKIDPSNFRAYPKNPIIARFFVNIGRSDTLGSGVRNLYEFTKIYSGGEPELIEGDVFQTIIPTKPLGRVTEDGVIADVDETTDKDDGANGGENGGVNGGEKFHLNNTQAAVLMAIRQNHYITTEQLIMAVGKTKSTIERSLKALKELGILRRVGPDKSGHWEVVEED